MNTSNKIKKTLLKASNQNTSLPKSKMLIFSGILILLLTIILTIAIPSKAVELTPPDTSSENISIVETTINKITESSAETETETTEAVPETTEISMEEELIETTEHISVPAVETTPTFEAPVNSNKSNNTPAATTPSHTNNTWDVYLGRFEVPSLGINVGCYNSGAQATVDAVDSAAYFNDDGHMIVADHVDQAFSTLKQSTVGTKATLTTNGTTKKYTCIGKINGHNTGTGITDANYNSISDYYPGALVAYTCNGSWDNITIVFFMPEEGNNLYIDSKGNVNKFENKTQEVEHSSSRFCNDLGRDHHWGDWKREWGNDAGTYEWRSRHCQLCPEEDWQMFDLVPPATESSSTEPTVEESVPLPPIIEKTTSALGETETTTSSEES